MAHHRRPTAALICLVCLLHFGAIATPPALAADTNLLVKNSLMSTRKITSFSPSPPAPALAPNQLKTRSVQTTWCVVKPSTSQEKLDEIINYCCTQPRVNCSVIQPGGECYFPPNKVSDASVVMNIFYRLNGKQRFNCDFKGSGLIIDQDPSVGKCVYQA